MLQERARISAMNAQAARAKKMGAGSLYLSLQAELDTALKAQAVAQQQYDMTEESSTTGFEASLKEWTVKATKARAAFSRDEQRVQMYSEQVRLAMEALKYAESQYKLASTDVAHTKWHVTEHAVDEAELSKMIAAQEAENEMNAKIAKARLSIESLTV